MYKYKDYNYSLEEVQDAADKENLSIDEYIKEFNIQKTDPDPDEEGKEAPSQETVDAAVEVSDTASNLEGGSLESQEIDNSPSAIFKRRKQNALDQAKVSSQPVELEEVVVTFDPSERTVEDLIDDITKVDDRIKLIAGDDMQIDALDSPKRIKEYATLANRRKEINDNLRSKLKEEGSTKSLLR